MSNRIFAVSYNYFDKPGLGWVIIFGTMLGVFRGTIGICCYLCWREINRKNPYSIMYPIVATALFQQHQWLITNDEPRSHFIVETGYYLTYAPFTGGKATTTDAKIPAGCPQCIAPSTQVEIRDGNTGIYCITTGKGLLRTYTWNGASRSLVLFPGNGSDGRYLGYPRDYGASEHWPAFDWPMHDGIARFKTYESIKNFKSVDQAAKWIKSESSEEIPCVYRNDGLLIRWSRNIEEETLWVLVYQILIKGKKPSGLPGADDGAIVVKAI